VSAASSAAATTSLDDDALIELGRTTAASGLLRRNLTAFVALAFGATALAALLLPSHRPLSLSALAVSLLCYALASGVHFEFGGVFATPTQPTFVAMWFLLPPRMLPLVACAGLILSAVPDLVRGRLRLEHLALYVGSSWFAVGPALVLFLLDGDGPRWHDVPVYVAALGAQFGFGFVSTYLTTKAVTGLALRAQLQATFPAFAVDTLLAPFGLLVAFAAAAHPAALLLVLPVLLLFATFAKERQHRIDNALELSNAYRGTAMLLGDVIEADDAYTGSHSRDVVDLVLAVADSLGLDARERRHAEFAALLHDVGKVKIPSAIINKPGPLDDEEWAVMKTHTVVGEQMLEQIGGLLGDVGRIVRSCHERWDGTGYPDAIAGEAIPLAARIVCACDAWSAMTTDRAYRRARSEEEAAAELHRCAGTHFDPRVVDTLRAVLGV
jgi:HD-GYP domain-containing protein (c-di-GMP phosphodiesterase class II)